MRLVLASASPRRAELLTTAGFSFDIAPAAVDETPHAFEPPAEYVVRVAREKAAAAAAFHARRPVLGADTAVVAAGQLLGKPADDEDARRMLGLLSGRVHDVLTGVVLLSGGQELSEVVVSRVRFATLSEAEREWYISTGEPAGKAGAYAIQGRASRFIEWIEGSWSNVVGLPVATVYRLLRRAEMV